MSRPWRESPAPENTAVPGCLQIDCSQICGSLRYPQGQPVAGGHDPRPQPVIEQHRPVVLVVDDERIIADTLALILRKNGFETQAVYSGNSAVETAMVLKPDVLISDVVMGGMNGIEAAIQICDSLPGCRVILFSGNAATAHLLESAEAEGYCFELLSKPIHPRALLDHLTTSRISMTG